ncbi:hypothetical protein ACTFIV_003039 [Dictyostelium citrinum]
MNFRELDTSNGVKAAESSFRTKVVLAREIPWNGFASSNSITSEQYNLISKYDKHTDAEKKEKFAANSASYVNFFVNFINSTSNIEIIQYLLTLINEIIEKQQVHFPKSPKMMINHIHIQYSLDY